MPAERDAIGTALFVGGPWDGRLEPAFPDDPEVYRVNTPLRLSAGLFTTMPQGVGPSAHVTHVDYRRASLDIDGTLFFFWVLPDMAASTLMARLIVAYHQQTQEDQA